MELGRLILVWRGIKKEFLPVKSENNDKHWVMILILAFESLIFKERIKFSLRVSQIRGKIKIS